MTATTAGGPMASCRSTIPTSSRRPRSSTPTPRTPTPSMVTGSTPATPTGRNTGWGAGAHAGDAAGREQGGGLGFEYAARSGEGARGAFEDPGHDAHDAVD